MSTGTVYRGTDLQLELVDPGVTLVRLFRYPKGDWDAPPQAFRNLRVDPPPGHKGDFAVLYTADTLPAVAMECRILAADAHDRHTWNMKLAADYEVVRYAHNAPALFIPIDGPNRKVLGLAGTQRKFAGYEPFQLAALELFQRYGNVAHGLCWDSFHRNQPGRVHAIWHSRKNSMGLAITSPAPYSKLPDDPEWKQFLADNPAIDGILP